MQSRLLTLLGGKQRYVDTFAVTPARLVPVVGTLTVSGGLAVVGGFRLGAVLKTERGAF